jgi:hypothetical protein
VLPFTIAVGSDFEFSGRSASQHAHLAANGSFITKQTLHRQHAEAESIAWIDPSPQSTIASGEPESTGTMLAVRLQKHSLTLVFMNNRQTLRMGLKLLGDDPTPLSSGLASVRLSRMV